MAVALSINGRAYDNFLRLYEDQFPVGEGAQYDPQFAGSLALGEGQMAIGEAVGNRHWQIPLIIKSGTPPTVDAAHALIQSIRADLFRGAQVAFQPEGASAVSYFDLESGELRPEFHHALHRKGLVKCTLELWTRPFSTTGTTRLAASAAGTSVMKVPATGIVGDVNALANVGISVPSPFPGLSDLFAAWGIAQSASYQPFIPAASLAFNVVGGHTASLIGASGAAASQYRAVAIGAADFDMAQFSLLPGDAHVGRHRVLGFLRSAALASSGQQGMSAQLLDQDQQALTTAASVGAAASSWRVVDLGELNVPAMPSGVAVPTPNFMVKLAMTSIASNLTTLNAQIAGLALIPVDVSAGIIVGDAIGFQAAAPQTHRFESYPLTRAYISATSAPTTFRQDAGRYVRGAGPRVPATGSPVASGGALLIALSGSVSNYFANGIFNVTLDCRERFSFYR